MLKRYLLLIICSVTLTISSQNSTAVNQIISKIYDLEKSKDAKCYATANRLEDFMYGTPLDEDARNTKIELQKKLILYLKEEGTLIAQKENSDQVTSDHLKQIIETISTYEVSSTGNYTYQLTTGNILILKRDFDHYSSVSYGYRSILSVEQDLFYLPEVTLLPITEEALTMLNDYVNLMTLAVLKVSDLKARDISANSISKKLLLDSWKLVLTESKNTVTKNLDSYPALSSKKNTKTNHDITNAIIQQKIASYKTYNNISENVFLRNIQVYFAKQKWPTDPKTSNSLRTYFLESLILYTSSLLEQANMIAEKSDSKIIRPNDVEKALFLFLPSSTNNFEDVTFFPNNDIQNITLESYDLDSFRDSGFHWRILGYALEDLLKESSIRELDPNTAEIIVEGIAQMGVLSLRLSGEHSKQNNRKVLEIEDLTSGFQEIQNLISTYTFETSKKQNTAIYSSEGTATNAVFENVSNEALIHFNHKSSDWLSRHIRSYTTATAEGTIKLAIPPAFGGSGVACEDINNDGYMDMLLLGGFGNKLYLGQANKKFKDITDTAAINNWNEALKSYGEPRQPIIADFNNDGLQDIFISYVNESNRIYKNIDGERFKDVSEIANLGGENAVVGPATTFDYNKDGLLDIVIGYFGNYMNGDLPSLRRDNQNGMPNKIFKNLGGFKFEEVSFLTDTSINSGWTQALGHADINQDGWQDIIEGNDFGKNKYYLNNGDGTFSEKSKELHTDKPSYTMNIGITDLNRDLFPDFYISNIVVMQKDEKYVAPNSETTMKFDRNKMANIRTVEANDLFLSSTNNEQLANYQSSIDIGRGFDATGWSWDADFFDFDNDGDEDLYCLNGMNDFSVYSIENPFYFKKQSDTQTVLYAQSNKERNVFFVNEGGKLINKAEALGVDINSNSRSASYLDYDNDGDLDMILNNYHDTALLYENKQASNKNWIKIKLIGNPKKNINRDAIGSTILLNSKNYKNIWREIHSTTGYLSVHPKLQHFGLNEDETVNVTVIWDTNEKFIFKNLPANKTHTITYPNLLLSD